MLDRLLVKLLQSCIRLDELRPSTFERLGHSDISYGATRLFSMNAAYVIGIESPQIFSIADA